MDTKKLYRLFYDKFDTSVCLNKKGEECSKESDVEFYYCGIEQDFKKDFVQQTIEEYFDNEDELYLIITSGNSSLVPIKTISEKIGKFLGKKEIGVMDKSLTKIMFFNNIGVFKKAIIKEYPKSRPKPENIPLEVSLHANMCEQSTQRISKILREPFEELEKKLSNDYQGCMEHLWIDIELVSTHSPHSFRFQKRVNIPSVWGGKNYYYNVGHYSIAPDFEKLKTLPDESALEYILNLMYDSMEILVKKKKRLGDFNAEKFRLDFKNICAELGYFFIEEENKDDIFVEISKSLTDKKMIKIATSLSKKYKPTSSNELEKTNLLLNHLYFKNQKNEALKVINLLEKEDFNGNYDLWSWIEPALLMKCWITKDESEIQKIINKINKTFDFGTNELSKKVRKNVKERRLKGEHLKYDEIMAPQNNKNTQEELEYRILHFYMLLFIYFLGGSKEFTKDRALKELNENEKIIKELI